MSNQETKNSLPEDSALQPVGRVSTMKVTFPKIGEVTIGVAHVDLNRAPEGSVLYVHPSVGRLTCEVEVANNNALHWKDGLSKANELNAELRMQLNRARGFLRRSLEFNCAHTAALDSEITKFLSGE